MAVNQKSSSYRAPFASGPRHGYVADLPFRERTKMRAQYRARQAKSFLDEYGVLIAIGGTALVALVYLKSKEQTKVGHVYPMLTP